MRIGDLAHRAGITPRMLRHYEEQGLIKPDRLANGYRDYGQDLLDRAVQIRGLLELGMPTRIIKQMLPNLNGVHICPAASTPEVVDILSRERDRMSARIDDLVRDRDSLASYLANLP